MSRIEKSSKIDFITATQDAIDSLSLSMFEALRELRDAVTPESHKDPEKYEKLIAQEDMGFDDFIFAFNRNDPYALELVRVADGKPPTNREEYLKIRAKMEMTKHSELIPQLATNILSKSAVIEDLIAQIPGIQSTKEEQMRRIQELMEKNSNAEEELKLCIQSAYEKRDRIRKELSRITCKALNIQENNSVNI